MHPACVIHQDSLYGYGFWNRTCSIIPPNQSLSQSYCITMSMWNWACSASDWPNASGMGSIAVCAELIDLTCGRCHGWHFPCSRQIPPYWHMMKSGMNMGNSNPWEMSGLGLPMFSPDFTILEYSGIWDEHWKFQPVGDGLWDVSWRQWQGAREWWRRVYLVHINGLIKGRQGGLSGPCSSYQTLPPLSESCSTNHPSSHWSIDLFTPRKTSLSNENQFRVRFS